MYDVDDEEVCSVEIDEDGLFDPDELHYLLARSLGFPPYYGGNLAALSDCLEDIDVPTLIIVRRADVAHRMPWLDGFCTVFERCARHNPALEVQIEEPRAARATMDDVIAKLEQIDRRLDAMQTARAAVTPAAAPVAPVAASETCRNKASGSDGDRFECGVCGCRVTDYLEDTRQLVDGIKFCPNCGREVTNPEGSNALGWVGELI